jgi:hypothetical protein
MKNQQQPIKTELNAMDKAVQSFTICTTEAEAILIITNAIDAGAFIRTLCKKINGEHNSEWCKSYFSTKFPRLLNTTIGKELMGIVKPDHSQYRYTAYSF